MQSHTGSLAWREIILFVFMGITLTITALYVPVFKSLISLLFSLLVALLVRKYHLMTALLSLAVVTLVTFFITGDIWAMFSFLAEAGIIGLATGLLFKNHLSAGHSLRIIIILSIVIATVILSLAYFLNGINPFVPEKELLDEIYQANRWYTDANMFSLEEQQQLEQQVKEIIGLMVVLLPGSMLIWYIIKSFLIYLFAFKMFKGLGYSDNKQLPSFRMWQYPWYVIWGLIVGLILFLAGDEWNLVLVGNLGKNVIYVMSFLFIVLGISVLAYFVSRWKAPGFLKGLTIFMICFYWPLGLGLVLILGLLDPILNLRKINVESGQGGKQE